MQGIVGRRRPLSIFVRSSSFLKILYVHTSDFTWKPNRERALSVTTPPVPTTDRVLTCTVLTVIDRVPVNDRRQIYWSTRDIFRFHSNIAVSHFPRRRVIEYSRAYKRNVQ
jgi:hypothetical protein